jgi:hypothetical protein
MIPLIDMLPIDIQIEFEKLTMVEEILISPILAIMSIYRLPNRALKQRGFIAHFSQDLTNITQVFKPFIWNMKYQLTHVYFY